MSTKKQNKLVETKDGVMRVEWADKHKSRMRRVDQRQFDKYLLSGNVTEEQHQAANWYYRVATTALATPHVQSQMGKLRVGTGNHSISNKQAEARLVLGRAEKQIEKVVSSLAVQVVRNVVLYDESMREQSRNHGIARDKTMILFRDGLDALDPIMAKFSY